MEFNTPVVVMEIYMELEIMIWIFVVCGDFGEECANKDIRDCMDFYFIGV